MATYLNNINFKTSNAYLSYFLGFLWADGHLDKHGGFRINIVTEDFKEIEHIFKKVGKYNIHQCQQKHWKPQTTI